MHRFATPRIERSSSLCIAVVDPGVGRTPGEPADNLGDVIIQRAVTSELQRLAPDVELIRISSHWPMRPADHEALRQAHLVVVGGSNLLSSRMRPYNRWNPKYDRWTNQWAMNLRDALRVRRAVLLGAGWIAYQGAPDLSTRLILRLALQRGGPHSVRDEYSRARLASAGFHGVLNTGCVTMWPLADRPPPISVQPARTALVMLTDYARKPELDRALLDLIARRYERVVAWPQGPGDAEYFTQLGFRGPVLPHSIAALDSFLSSSSDFDYIGTRLHGGIRCLNDGRRALILEVDNRAAEIAKDTGLPTARRDDFDRIECWAGGSPATPLRLNHEAIGEWRAAMARNAAHALSPRRAS